MSNEYTDNMVSVIMPAYNSSKYISYAVESVLKQSYQNWELLIHDDKSGDDTIEKAAAAAGNDKRIQIFSGKTNGGVAVARNSAIGRAKGRYLAFLDSDDLWNPEKLDVQLKFMKETGCAVCYSSYRFIDIDGEKKGERVAQVKPEADYAALLKDNFMGTLTVIIDRDQTGDIRFSKERHEDLILWLDLARRGYKILGIKQPLAFYRVAGGSLSGNKIKAAAWRWNIYRKTEGLNWFQSIWYMSFYFINSIKKRISA